MKESLRLRLDQLCDRHEELEALLADVEVISDNKRFRNLSREHNDLTEITDVWKKYKQASSNAAPQCLHTGLVLPRDSAGVGTSGGSSVSEVSSAFISETNKRGGIGPGESERRPQAPAHDCGRGQRQRHPGARKPERREFGPHPLELALGQPQERHRAHAERQHELDAPQGRARQRR